MKHLIKKGKRTVDTYIYKIRGLPNLQDEVTIHFVNGKFERCIYPFSGCYRLQEWNVLREISEKISAIDNFYNGDGTNAKDKDI